MWIFYSLLATIAGTTGSLLSKKVVSEINEYAGLWTYLLFGFLVSIIYVGFAGFTISSNLFWLIIPIRLMVDSLAAICYFKALKIEEVSFVTPILSLSPIFIMFSSYLINGQIPSIMARWGVIFIVFGTFLLFASKINHSSNKSNSKLLIASGLVIATTILWSVASALHKQGINYSSPATYFFVSYAGFTLIFTLIAYLVARPDMHRALDKHHASFNILNGLALGLDQIFTLTAIATGPVVLVESLKGSGLIFTTLFARVYLKEQLGRRKLIGIISIFCGLLLIIR
jgi:bacterial/archaeal transporter family protein